ncbi:MAG: PLDc N-terminal domain-containing protein [Alphaproteobacteria bacterium]|nr:PLDc N-terminal domain-containing protein [Alphaproteobacteria bacterium]
MLFGADFSFANFLADVLAVFFFVLWFWLLITVAGDLFRRRDVSGGGKILWVLLLILLPYLGIFAYLLTQGGGMAERAESRARAARDELRQIAGFSVADEIEKLDSLKARGKLSEQEYATLRGRLTA